MTCLHRQEALIYLEFQVLVIAPFLPVQLDKVAEKITGKPNVQLELKRKR